jgi:hypothetical protein
MSDDSWLELRHVGRQPQTIALVDELTVRRDTGQTDVPATTLKWQVA